MNFAKSCMFGVNVDMSFLDRNEEYLPYKVDTLPFKYLGLLVGANPKK